LPSKSFIQATLSGGAGPLQGTVNLNIGSNGGKGTATYTNLRIDVADNLKRLTFSSTNGLTSVTSAVFAVAPAAASKLVIGTQPSATAVAGTLFSRQPVIFIEDTFNNVRTSDTLAVTAARNAGTGTLSGSTTISAVNGVATFTDLAHPVAGNITILFSSGSLTTATSSTIAVSAGSFARLVTLLPGQTVAPGTANGVTGNPSLTAGASTVVRVNATDNYFNPVGGVADTIGITATDPNAGLPANFALVNGTNSASVVLRTAGPQTLTANDVSDASKGAHSQNLTVAAGAFARLQALVPGEVAAPGTATGKTGTAVTEAAGVAFSLVVNSVDANWNLIQTNDTVHLVSTDPAAVLPANGPLLNGTATFNVALTTAGAATITASDVTHATVTPSTTASIPVSGGQQIAQTITFGALNNITYGAPAFTLTATASSGLPVSFSILSGPASLTGNLLTITGTGLVTVRASQSGNATYSPAPNVDRSFTVNPTQLTVTADNKSRAAGSANPPFTASYSGFVYGETASVLSGTPSLSTSATTSSPAGNYPITVTQGTLAAANYTFSFVNGTLTVTNVAQTITFAPLGNLIYGAAPLNLTATASSGLPVSFSLVSGPATLNGGTLTITGTGSITVRASQSGNSIYAPAPNVDRSFSVTQAPLTVTADNKSRAVGSPNPPLTASYAGFVNGEGNSVLSGTPSLSTVADVNSSAGTYPITVSQGTLGAANYSFNFINGTLTVTNG
ncbi:MAG TPA: MBG domain-containing protein, partial [Verrucomicrobiae bacterium]|nr:MBG domain-containing protein [Verrucomicrobiae bacterium]